ncbi:MAG: hypothetical protein HY815_16910 [Candidatus Riflebacteria bacterium]|nr:hypothetical protein [Candidatus Riflebacteria bacterium]
MSRGIDVSSGVGAPDSRCARFKARISSLLAGESVPDRAELDAHRAVCVPCEAELLLARRIEDIHV